MRLLLISNSTNPGEQYLDYPKNNIREFLGARSVRVLFIPYAAVTFSYDIYEQKVSDRFREVGHDLVSNGLRSLLKSILMFMLSG